MKSLIPYSSQERLGAIDSLRGLASMFVLFGHIMGSFEWKTDFIQLPIVYIFFDGTSAVVLFFVLSGFVLTFGHLKQSDRPFELIPFYVRRITRIWLPWFAIFVLSLIAKDVINHGQILSFPSTSEWLLSKWQGSTKLEDVISQMIFQFHNPNSMLMCQDWSLGVELRVALFIPLLLVLAKWRWFSVVLIGITFPYMKSSGYYYMPFCAGVLVACWSAKNVKCRRPVMIVVFGLLLYQIRWLILVTDIQFSVTHEREIWLTSAIGCSLILAGVIRSSKCQKFLEHKYLLYLGRVSYSLYLLQMLILICLAPRIVALLNSFGFTSTWIVQILVLFIVCAICLILADICERFIERPCIQFGKIITSKLNAFAFVRCLKV